MTFIVAIEEVHVYLDIEEECELILYSINKGIKTKLRPTAKLQNKHAEIVNIPEFQINHQTLIIDVILARNKAKQKIKEKEKKKAGYITLHLQQYKQNKTIELELELKDCIVKDATLELKLKYRKVANEFEQPSFEQHKKQHQKPKQILEVQEAYDENIKQQREVILRKVAEMEKEISKQSDTIKSLEKELFEQKMIVEEERNKTQKMEEMYRKERREFENETSELNRQLMTSKNQLTEIIDILNERGQASILQVVQDLITK